jgi:hypothetical protein
VLIEAGVSNLGGAISATSAEGFAWGLLGRSNNTTLPLPIGKLAAAPDIDRLQRGNQRRHRWRKCQKTDADLWRSCALC